MGFLLIHSTIEKSLIMTNENTNVPCMRYVTVSSEVLFTTCLGGRGVIAIAG